MSNLGIRLLEGSLAGRAVGLLEGLGKAKKDLPRTTKLMVAGDDLRALWFTDIRFFCNRKNYGRKADLKSIDSTGTPFPVHRHLEFDD